MQNDGSIYKQLKKVWDEGQDALRSADDAEAIAKMRVAFYGMYQIVSRASALFNAYAGNENSWEQQELGEMTQALFKRYYVGASFQGRGEEEFNLWFARCRAYVETTTRLTKTTWSS